jgi:hypothetical protein
MSLPTAGYSDINCKLSYKKKSMKGLGEQRLIVRDDITGKKAILMTEHLTRIYECAADIIYKYECYGFMDPSFGAPTQLNITDTAAGGEVVAISLNLAFLKKYANDGYESKNMDMRRFSVDNYLIDSCTD